LGVTLSYNLVSVHSIKVVILHFAVIQVRLDRSYIKYCAQVWRPYLQNDKLLEGSSIK